MFWSTFDDFEFGGRIEGVMINSSHLRSYYQVQIGGRFTEDIPISSLVYHLRSYYRGQCVFGRYSMILNRI